MYSGCRRWYLRERKRAQVVAPRTKSAGMSEYSQAWPRMEFRTGLPFWRVETRMELGPARWGRACGFGCWTLLQLLVEAATYVAEASSPRDCPLAGARDAVLTSSSAASSMKSCAMFFSVRSRRDSRM